MKLKCLAVLILKSQFCSCNVLLDKLELTRFRGGQDKESSSLNPILWDGPSYETSVCSVQGKRPYMEDEHISTANGRLVAVIDGHGGSAVSSYA